MLNYFLYAIKAVETIFVNILKGQRYGFKGLKTDHEKGKILL